MGLVAKNDFFCQNRDEFSTILGPNQRIVDVENSHLGSILRSVESCKEKDLNVYVKFVKLRSEKVQVLVHEKELRVLDLHSHFPEQWQYSHPNECFDNIQILADPPLNWSFQISRQFDELCLPLAMMLTVDFT